MVLQAHALSGVSSAATQYYTQLSIAPFYAVAHWSKHAHAERYVKNTTFTVEGARPSCEVDGEN